MNEKNNQLHPLFFSLSTYILLTFLLVLWGIFDNYGILTYPLDDTYIHMAVAKNLAEYGVWGATQYQFNSSSSSLLWTLSLTSVYLLSGVSEWPPLIINLLAGVAIIFSCEKILRSLEVPPNIRLAALICVVLFTSLPSLTLVGMEHLAHGLASLWFLWLSAQLLTQHEKNGASTQLLLVASCGLVMTALRYEGLFTVSIAVLFLLLYRRWFSAITIAACGALPILAFGLYSLSNDGNFLPNSILMKGHIPDLSIFSEWIMLLGGRAVSALFDSITLTTTCLWLALAFSLYRYYRTFGNLRSPVAMFGVMLLLSISLHLQFARFGWLFRYEAYLILSGIIAVTGLVWTILPSPFPPLPKIARTVLSLPLAYRLLVVLFATVTTVAYGARAVQSSTMAALSMNDRYLEHVLTARFVTHFYDDATLVINDLGALAYYSNAKFLDIYGLGSDEPIAWRSSHFANVNFAAMRNWVQGSNAQIALLQTEFNPLYKGLPQGWVHVANWNIPRNLVFNDRVVGFYAKDFKTAITLRQNLRTFSKELPSDINLNLQSNRRFRIYQKYPSSRK